MTVIDLREHAEDFNSDPYPYFAKMRAAGPVHQIRTNESGDVWVVVGYEEGRAALADPRLSKDPRTLTAWGPDVTPSPTCWSWTRRTTPGCASW